MRDPLMQEAEIRYHRENPSDHSLALLIAQKKQALDGNLPSTFFSGAGSDTAWFEILGPQRPSWYELSRMLDKECCDYMLMEYNETDGMGYFVAVDSDAPRKGVLILSLPPEILSNSENDDDH